MVAAFGAQATDGSELRATAGVVGALQAGYARILIWILAIVLDVGAPMHAFRLPGVAPTPIGDWTLASAHLAERCQLVLMIALGESVLPLAWPSHSSGARSPWTHRS